MNEVIARIKESVLLIYPTILADLAITDALLNFVIKGVVNRALVYMNRDVLVDKYEDDLILHPPSMDVYKLYWRAYAKPIPPALEEALAGVVVGAARTMVNGNTSETGAITSVSDHGQSVSYSKDLASFFSSSDDSQIFSGISSLLKNYRLGKVVCDEATSSVQTNY